MAAESKSGGIGVMGLLGVLFVGLKLGHVIDWSWWWVLLPFYLGLVIVAVLFIFAGICFGIAGIIGALAKSKRPLKSVK